MSYSDYLALDQVLTAQHPQSSAHDEMLFIIQHQTSELWMRLALHEIDAARDAVTADNLPVAFKMLARVSRIFEQLNAAWDVLRTMTPSEYTLFRPALGTSSGFQSWQYRLIEFKLGNRKPSMVSVHQGNDDTTALLEAELNRPSLYDCAIQALARAGFALPDEIIQRNWREKLAESAPLTDAWANIYEAPEPHWDLYQLAEKLVDLEDYFRRWRFNHVTTVERIIGMKAGTGGTGGVPYLRAMLDVELFPELWHVRTRL